MREARIPNHLVWGVVAICVLPFLLNLAGVDFGSTSRSLNTVAVPGMSRPELVDAMHTALSGSYTHTLLEWTAFCTAIFTVLLAFINFRITHNPTIPIIAVALFCAGLMDAFHTLAADRLIDAVADNTDLIPFTWAISRLFNALILIIGVSLLLVRGRKESKASVRFVLIVSAIFGIVAYTIIHYAATSARLPNTMFPDSLVTRPYDVAPLLLYAFAGLYLFPRFHRKVPSIFAHALVIAMIPEVVTQLHMSFGSTALFDNHFNIAHGIKVLAYFVPFLGLSLDYVQSYQEKTLAVSRLQNAQQTLEERTQQLEGSERQFRTLLESTPEAMVIANRDGRITLVNRQTEKIFGYTREEMIGQPVEMLIPEQFRKRHVQHIRGYASDPHIRTMGSGLEVYGRRKDGSEFPAEVSLGPIETEEGLLMASTVVDITKRREAEAAMARLQRQNELILNSAGEGIYGLDLEGNTTFVNLAAARMLGWEPNELIGKSEHALIHYRKLGGNLYPKEECPIHATLQDGTVHRASREVFWQKDGTSFPVEYIATPIQDEHGQLVGAVVTFQDISARLEIDKMKNEFVSTVSHELRTPLTSIRGSLGLLAGGLLGSITGKGQRMLDIAVNNTDRLVRLINDILDIERIESGRTAMEKQDCDADSLCSQAADTIRSMADKTKVTLLVTVPSIRLWADPDRILQTLTNLLSNAIKFSPPGETIEISAEPAGEFIQFAVKDQGRGIPPDKLKSIFERFQQVDASDSRDKGGTGLGLAICRSIVQQHGGKIWVESEMDKGSTFYFTLPKPKEQVTVTGSDSPVGGAKRTALVCDDEDDAPRPGGGG